MTYSAKAVRFNGTQELNIASLSCTDNGTFSVSVWLANTVNNSNPGTLFISDPATNEDWYVETTSSGTIRNTLWNDAATSSQQVFVTNGTSVPICWHHHLFSIDLSAPGQFAYYIDGQYMDPLGPYAPGVNRDNAPFTPGINGRAFRIGRFDGSDFYDGYVCDLWIAPGVSLLDPGTMNTISPTDIAKFRSAPGIAGIPIDSATLPTSAMLFTGDAAGFIVNSGTGGAAVLTGAITDAPNSPTDQVVAPMIKTRLIYSARQTADAGGDTFVQIPADWDASAPNTIHGIGAGESGGNTYLDATTLGGRGGSYARVSNVTTLAPCDYAPSHVDQDVTGDSFLKNVSGTTLVLAPSGYSGTMAVGDVVHAGGASVSTASDPGIGTAGGGGAGGPDGVGQDSSSDGSGGDSGLVGTHRNPGASGDVTVHAANAGTDPLPPSPGPPPAGTVCISGISPTFTSSSYGWTDTDIGLVAGPGGGATGGCKYAASALYPDASVGGSGAAGGAGNAGAFGNWGPFGGGGGAGNNLDGAISGSGLWYWNSTVLFGDALGTSGGIGGEGCLVLVYQTPAINYTQTVSDVVATGRIWGRIWG